MAGPAPVAEATTSESKDGRRGVAARRGAGILSLGAFLGPALIFYALFMIVPLLGTIVLGFTEWPGFNLTQLSWVGLDNFRELAGDSVFWASLQHNLILLVGAVVLKTTIALVLALLLDQRLPGAGLFRGIFLMPTILSLVVVGLVFGLGLSPTLGFVNPFLEAIGLDALTGDWLGDPDRVLWTIVLLDTWQGFGLYMFLFIARLITIPQDVRDAASIDGAGEFRTTWSVILPLLRSTISMVVLLAAIESLKMFELIYVMTSGGPNHASEVISSWGYFQGFTASRVGYGSSILIVLLLLTFALAYVYTTRFRMGGDDD